MEIGFLGLGEMGGPMARNLLKAGHSLRVFDPDSGARAALAGEGARECGSEKDVVTGSDVVMTSLPSSEAFVEVAEKHLVPNARAGQVFVDFGTAVPLETRRIAGRFSGKGAFLLDVPVSGGPHGAAGAKLYMFAGGDEAVFLRMLPVLEKLGDPSRITYCGPSGSGEIAKGVNQLAMGLSTAAFIEAAAFGVRAGLDPKLIHRAVSDANSGERWRAHFEAVASQIASGNGEKLGVKFRELPYFLRHAEAEGFRLPLTAELYSLCNSGERVVMDDHRPAPSYWVELMGGEEEP